jgi:1-acyl-sn-glycerol-3-phosphate acyltransferase
MQSGSSSHISLPGWLRVVRRSSALIGWLLTCLALYVLRAVLPGRNRVPRRFLAGVLRIVGGRLVITGEPVGAPSILLANHLSWIDIPALAAATGCVFVAHEGLAAHPALRFLCRLNRTVFIARSHRASVGGQVDQVREGLHDSGVLTLFPEGTTGDNADLLPFKSSLLAAVENSGDNVAIRPVALDYGTLTPRLAWLGDEPGPTNFKRVLARKGHFTVTVHLLAPLALQQRRDRKTIAAAAHQAVAERLA